MLMSPPISLLRRSGLALLLLCVLAACDSSPDIEDVAESRFEAMLSGTVNKTIRGNANTARSDAVGDALSGLLVPLPISPSDSGRFSLPDSLVVPPRDSFPEPPPGTALVLATADVPGQGEGLTFFFEGEGRLPTGEYSITIPVLSSGDSASPFPQSGAFGAYSQVAGQVFTLAPIVGGDVTIETSTAEVVRGRFSLQTAQALEFTLPAPGDTTFADNVTPRLFATVINGTFVATPADLPAVPAPQP